MLNKCLTTIKEHVSRASWEIFCMAFKHLEFIFFISSFSSKLNLFVDVKMYLIFYFALTFCKVFMKIFQSALHCSLWELQSFSFPPSPSCVFISVKFWQYDFKIIICFMEFWTHNPELSCLSWADYHIHNAAYKTYDCSWFMLSSKLPDRAINL